MELAKQVPSDHGLSPDDLLRSVFEQEAFRNSAAQMLNTSYAACHSKADAKEHPLAASGADSSGLAAAASLAAAADSAKAKLEAEMQRGAQQPPETKAVAEPHSG